jgi:hypothetical protein
MVTLRSGASASRARTKAWSISSRSTSVSFRIQRAVRPRKTRY